MTLRSSDTPGVEMVVLPPVRDLGDGFKVRRALPSAHRRMVGPFIFFDQMGPVVMQAGKGLDVRPHPHIGLATVTYLLDGEIVHRDSLGTVQAIRPGAVNWMTAGAGITHSERSGAEARAAGGTLYGLQTWVALPRAAEAAPPAFAHYEASAIPAAEAEGARLTVVVGSEAGLTSPVVAASPTLFADIALDPGARWQIRPGYTERAVYVVSGRVSVAGQAGGFGAGELVVLKPDAEIVLQATEATRLMLVGGEPLGENRHIFWNFVSSRREQIEQAKQDWRAGRFPGVPGDAEFIPLPDDPPGVSYP